MAVLAENNNIFILDFAKIPKMEGDVVSIRREEFELLVKCRRIVDSDFEEKFSDEFIKAVKKSEKDYNKGRFIRFSSKEEMSKHLDAL